MDFSLRDRPKLNKDLILSTLTEEQIFAFYIGTSIKSKKLFRSPLRRDNRPTCSMYRSKSGSLIFKDFGSGQHLNCFGFVMEMFHCSYFEALRIIANDFNIVHDETVSKNKGKVISKDFKITEKEFSKIGIEAKPFNELELKWWGKYGITEDILKKYDVYSCKHVFLNDHLIAKSQQHCPIYGYYGKKYQGYELWKIYFPKRKEYRWMTNYPAKKMQGYEQLPKSGKLVVITKSLKDTMCFNSLGIPACAPNSETIIPSESVINDLKNRFKYVVCLWDNDYTGIVFLNKFRKKYNGLLYTWIPRKYEAKDISDFYKKYGRKKTLELINSYLLWLQKK